MCFNFKLKTVAALGNFVFSNYLSFSFLDGLVAYVHRVSPVKRARMHPDCQYYDMVLQTKDKNVRGISYRCDLHKKFEQKMDNREPIKLQNFRQIPDRYNPNDVNIKVSSKTIVKDPEKAPFVYAENPNLTKEIAPYSTLGEILAAAENQKMVSVKVYASVKDRPCVDIPSRFESGFTTKRDIQVNDVTGKTLFHVLLDMTKLFIC